MKIKRGHFKINIIANLEKGYSAISCKIYVHEFIVMPIEIAAILKYFQRSNHSYNFIIKAIPHKIRGNE